MEQAGPQGGGDGDGAGGQVCACCPAPLLSARLGGRALLLRFPAPRYARNTPQPGHHLYGTRPPARRPARCRRCRRRMANCT